MKLKYLVLIFVLWQVVKLINLIRIELGKNWRLNRVLEHQERNHLTESNKYDYKRYRPLTKADFESAFVNERMEANWKRIIPLLKPEARIRLTREEENEIPIGVSKVGGRPDMPEEEEWPRQDTGKHLVFLAQFNLEELSEYNLELPSEGMIYFFYSEEYEFWGDSKERANDFRVIYLNEPKNLIRREVPDTIVLIKDGMHRPCKVEFLHGVSLPEWEDDRLNEVQKGSEWKRYEDITSPGEMISKLGGYANTVQGSMEYQCEMVDLGYKWGEMTDEKRDRVEAGQNKWTLLFQLDSEEEAMMEWGDVGKLYFWIKEEDLKQARFEKTWFIFQCH